MKWSFEEMDPSTIWHMTKWFYMKCHAAPESLSRALVSHVAGKETSDPIDTDMKLQCKPLFYQYYVVEGSVCVSNLSQLLSDIDFLNLLHFTCMRI